MNILHICNDYSGSRVHQNLYLALDNLNIKQVVFCPIRYSTVPLKNEALYQNSKIVFSKKTSKSHRVLFKSKIKFLYKDILNKIDPSKITLSHATTLFSDGAIALQLYKDFNIPYVVAVRGTDVNLFIKYRLDLHALGKEIIANAKRVVFISDSLSQNFNNSSFAKNIKSHMNSNQIIIPNGIDTFWLKNLNPKSTKNSAKRFLYIGKFVYNKNTLRLIQAFLNLNKKYDDIVLTLVGKGGKEEEKIRTLSEKYPKKIKLLGPIYDKKELLKVYRENDILTMPSISETFGLVYIEALIQGLPVLYAKGQGIDGTFKHNIGTAVDPKSTESIRKGMEDLMQNYDNKQIEKIDFTPFNWDNIAKKYARIYAHCGL